MASMQKTSTSCEVDEEEYEDYEEEEIEEDVDGEEYEEEIEEEVYEEEEEEEEAEEEEVIEQNDEEEEDEKKVVEVQKLQEEEEEEFVQDQVQDQVKEEEKSTNLEQQSESERNAPVVFPTFLQSVSDLEKLHCALSKFLYQWNSLNSSLDSISAAIDAHAPSQHDALSIEQKKDERSEQEKEKRKDERSWVEILCEEMQGKSLRKYIESNFSDLDRLRCEVPEALRRLPNPEKLVFEGIGKFYTQGKKAYTNSTPLISCRRASILLLEFFVLSGRPTEDSSVKQDAMHGALFWWKRLVNEDIESASAVDSLGLILFLACFGIPKGFGSMDLCLLLLKSNLKKKGDLFRRSSILVKRIPGVIKDLIRKEMYVEAAELSCCFGLNDTFPPLPLLSSFVVKVIQIGKREQQESKGSPRILKEANIKELTSLKSVVKCVEDYNLDIHKLASGNIHQQIFRLEKYIENDEIRFKTKILKRKANHLESDKKSETQSKESFHSTSEASQNTPSQMIQDKPEQGLPAQPLLPDSRVENSVLSAAVSNAKDYPHGWESTYYETSAGYRSSAMEYPTAQHFYQAQASIYGNGGGISGRNLYQFADTVIQNESQLSKSNRSSNTSPAGAKFGPY